MSECCLTLICPPAIEEKLLDLLLLSSTMAVFTSTPTAAHGLATQHMSQAEQVLGRALATQVQVLLPAEAVNGLLQEIRLQFSGTALRYWLTNVTETGEF